MSGTLHQIIVVVTGFKPQTKVVTEHLIKFLAVLILRLSGQAGLVFSIRTRGSWLGPSEVHTCAGTKNFVVVVINERPGAA